ncbi:DUF202 domain-containing protein [Pseudaestuariivita atlantica]|uniref:DUF202 domain-containing protein n=1 Tax=Pseudaestuariivita atlantica TaxID=1317121 RepID=A0A0L1JS82_9RHOB|nr:DUF202 domain-containing protein [Pseudaestuariivita atlantica]KNG94601.1 hypothetical protein ATO11_04140 [Pseudaestuariivita atlantica]
MIKNFADHASNERTFLAWVRTVIAIEGFGLVAARINDGPTRFWSELGLLLAGLLVLVLAYVRLRHVRARIDDERPSDDEGLFADGLLLALVAAMFVLIGAFGLHVW